MIRELAFLAATGLLAAVSGPAFADCTISGSLRQCVDTVEEVHTDADGNIYVWVTADDEADLACTLATPTAAAGTSESSTVNGLILRPTNASFDKNHQTLLLAAASFLRVDINVVLNGAACDISDVSLRP